MSLGGVFIIEHVPISDHVESNVCIEFEALFDIPFGIMRLIREKYNDPTVFEQHWIKADTYTLRCLLYERDIYNPIYAAMREDSKDLEFADKILKDITNDHLVYKSLLTLSPPISMFNLLKTFDGIYSSHNEMINYTVICKNKIQYDFLKKQIPTVNAKITTIPFNIDLSMYHLLIVERFENILRYMEHGKIEGKTIWIPEFWYNMDIDDRTIPSMELVVLCADVNVLHTYEPYNNFNKPVG